MRKLACTLSIGVLGLVVFLAPGRGRTGQPPILPNQWTKLAQEEQGARRFSSFRYVDDGQYFLLWGFMGHITDDYGEPDKGWNGNKEYDVVTFDPRAGKWQSQLPFDKENEWSKSLPPVHECSSYQGITTGSYRPQLKVREGVLRPDLNLVFDQLAYDSKRARMIYFTGGRTFAYDVRSRKWSDAAPNTPAPPPVSTGTLAYDRFNDEIVLAGGAHVAEKGPGGKIVGFTGTWLYNCERSQWRPLGAAKEPPPRMNTRLVLDTKTKLMVMFGGDAQSRYLADTWLYDTRTRQWRQSEAAGGPPPRAGHFTVYDPATGWVIIGGGYNRKNLTDMWAYDAAADKWLKLKGDVPTGWHVTGDIMPKESLIVLTTATKLPGDHMGCNEIYPVRTTYAFKVQREGLIDDSVTPQRQQDMLKRSLAEATEGTQPDPKRRAAQLERIRTMPVNRWVQFTDPGRVAPLRTWGSCTFDTDKGRIVYWGGGHCGYGGSDYDLYDVEQNTWIAPTKIAEYPERAWDLGINAAGVTFSGVPFIRHGRKVYAYDPVSKKIINTKTVLLTAGYEPEPLKNIEPKNPDFGAAEQFTRSSYRKWATWSYDPAKDKWEIVCSGVPGLDLTVTTPKGVMAIDHYWDTLGTKNKNDEPNSVYLLDVARRQWKKFPHGGNWPRNLYELTALVYDSKRDQLILHGGGPKQDELWTYSLSNQKWAKLDPQFAPGTGGKPPVCNREAVYLPDDDVVLTAGYPAGGRQEPALYAYSVGENRWYRLDIPSPPGKRPNDIIGQNRAWSYDPIHKLVFMVLGGSAGDKGNAQVFALRYKHAQADLAR